LQSLYPKKEETDRAKESKRKGYSPVQLERGKVTLAFGMDWRKKAVEEDIWPKWEIGRFSFIAVSNGIGRQNRRNGVGIPEKESTSVQKTHELFTSDLNENKKKKQIASGPVSFKTTLRKEAALISISASETG